MATYDDLSALFINCTLERSPEQSNTQGLIDVSAHIMAENGVAVSHIRAVDHDIATGVWPDMTERLGHRRVARAAGTGDGRRHPGDRGTDLAR
ncbi:hypothetical protein GCM10011610_24560 [Nocardia rhizosphaerihabitans]|uniref:Uncharacterized protein n=1 Tax=Nocardia rhizosphaerihabitans TaxID=1691570 RepID=A0ABQ2KAK3_9NOCA|nr:hypothetical protein GCM10011610_24560 [Nocardia rhizosphaerihabitans]